METQIQNILVTGSEGGIGQYIIRELYRQNDNISVIRTSRNPCEDKDGISKYYHGDLTDSAVYKKIFSENRIDTVIACAALWNGINQDQNVLITNTLLITVLLYAVPPTVKNVIFFSSSAVYSDDNYDDRVPLRMFPSSTYGASKLFSEELLVKTAQIKDFTYTIYRPFHVVSPAEIYQPGRSHVCTDFCYKIISKDNTFQFEALGDTNGIGFTWVEDVADTVVRNIENAKAHNQIFNIGTEEEYSIRALALEISEVAYEKKLIDTPTPKLECVTINHQTDGRFNKLNGLNSDALKTNFKTLIQKFISEKYLKEYK